MSKICTYTLADRQQTTIPTSTAKQVLHNAGLGLKKIKFLLSDNEEQIAEKNMSAEKSADEETMGFSSTSRWRGV